MLIKIKQYNTKKEFEKTIKIDILKCTISNENNDKHITIYNNYMEEIQIFRDEFPYGFKYVNFYTGKAKIYFENDCEISICKK